jgi:hypothetical protein
MQYNDLVKLLTQARAKAQVTGTALTENDVAGISGGFFNDASNKSYQNRQIDLQAQGHKDKLGLAEDSLELERWKMLKMLEAAKKGQRNNMIGNLLNTGVSAYGLYNLK